MDRNSIIGFILIAILITGWLLWQSFNQRPLEPLPKEKKAKTEEVSKKDTSITNISKPYTNKIDVLADSLDSINKYGQTFAPYTNGYEEIIVVENELVRAKLTNKGAALLEWKLKNYKSWNQYPTQLIWNKGGQLFLTFPTREIQRGEIDSRDLFFKYDNNGKNYFSLKGNDSLVLTATLQISQNKSIVKKYTFYGNKYSIVTDIIINNLDDIFLPRGYNLSWTDGLRYQEMNSVDESSDAVAMTSIRGELFEIDASDDEPVKEKKTGVIEYSAIKLKYFTAAIIPQPKNTLDATVDLSGSRQHTSNDGVIERYNMSYRIPYKSNTEKHSFLVYIGPLDYDIVSDYGLEATVNFGWRWLIRPIGEYFMLPFFKLIHYFVANYGISLLIFSLLMKIILYPLSIGQMRSANKMKLLAPEMEKVREKYKDDPKLQQTETMKLYSEYGINPAGGCLPLLLQMPILYALWAVLRTSIDLRQAYFFWWITDLSTPDSIVTLPFSFLGIKSLSGLALLMGITMFIQQKLTITDPKQKSLVYVMPIMFTLMFSNFPAGLNLYYFMFNLLSIIQQVWINKYSKNRLTLQDLKKMPKKEGWLQKKMREAQEIASSQGRSLPGQPYENTKSKYQRKKGSSGRQFPKN